MRKISLICMLAAGLIMAAAAGTMAAGTPAGTVISNQASADYQDANGNALPTVLSNVVTTTVSQVAAVSVTPPTDANAALTNFNATDVVYLIQIGNTGNAADTFSLATSTTAGWTPDSVALYRDNGDGIFNAGTDTLMGGDTGLLNADEVITVFLVVTIPDEATAPDGSTSTVQVSATSQFDGAVSGAGSYTTTSRAAVISVAKSFNSPGAPGGVVTYTIAVTNTGSGAASQVRVRDAIPANTIYVPSTINLNGSVMTDAADSDEADFNATYPGEVYLDLGTIAGGGSATVTFQVQVGAAVPEGTTITNTSDIAYGSGPNPKTATASASFDVTIITALDLQVVGPAALQGDPGDRMIYRFSVINNGNLPDIADLSFVSSAGWTWEFWTDPNGDGDPADGVQITDSGSIAAYGGSVTLLAAATIPAGTADGAADALDATGTSRNDAAISDTVTFTTTVTAPLLAVTKSVSPAGNQPPGTELTYTVTVVNNGTGLATGVVVTDAVPQYTTYAPASIRTRKPSDIDLTSRTDAADGDEAAFDGGNNRVTAGGAAVSLATGEQYVVEFRVTIN